MKISRICIALITFALAIFPLPANNPPGIKSVFSKDGAELIILERLGNGGLVLRVTANETNDKIDCEETALSVSGKVDSFSLAAEKSGSVILAWIESHGDHSHVFTAGFDVGSRSIKDINLVFSGSFSHSLQLIGNAKGKPLLAFIEESFETRIVLIELIEPATCFLPAGRSSRSLLLIADSQDQPWIFWLGNGSGGSINDINYSRYIAGRWLKPETALAGNGRARLFLHGRINDLGRPRLVWSESVRRDYTIHTTTWNGTLWLPGREISRLSGIALEPRLAFPDGRTAWVFWNQRHEGGSVFCSHLEAGEWSQEKTIEGPAPVRLSDLKTIQGSFLLILQEDGLLRNRKISPVEILSSGRPREKAQFPSIPTGFRDENLYLAFGDSITFGYMDYQEAESEGYIPRLEEMLKNKFGQARTINAGNPGEITADGLARIGNLLREYPVLFNLIMEGTNDMIFLDITMESSADNLRLMAEMCIEEGIVPLLATIIPRNDWWWHNTFFRQRLFDLNEMIRETAADLGITLVDQFDAFFYYPQSEGGWTSLLSSDLSHPNEKGYQVMAETWFEALKKLKIKIFPPLNFTGTQVRTLKINQHFVNLFNILQWLENPLNADSGVISHRIYRKEKGRPDSEFIMLATIPASRLRYNDRMITENKTYVYAISAIDSENNESEKVAIEVTPI